MRIAVWYNLPSGGARRALHDHVNFLLEAGHTVEVWCPPTADRSFLPFGNDVVEHVVDLDWPIEWTRLDDWQITLNMRRRLSAMEEHCRACAQQIDAGSFDILFCNSCMFFGTSPIARFARTPSVLYLQEPFRQLYEAMPEFPWLAPPEGWCSATRPSTFKRAFIDFRTLRNNRAQARAEVTNAKMFKSILVNSFFSRESVLRAYGINSEVCYLGIDTDHFQAFGFEREPFAVGLGSLTLNKNAKFCIEAIGTISAPRPRLVWIGNFADPAYQAEAEALAQASGVDFQFLTRIPDTDLIALLNKAALMVYAPRLEPFGLAPLEANACALPVVAVAEGGIRETITDGQNGLLTPADPAAMGRAVTRLLAEPALAGSLGEAARDRVIRHWSLDAAGRRLEDALMRHAR